MHIPLIIQQFTSSYNLKKLFALFLLAFGLRAATFYFYVQHEERYQQPDTLDYHNCTICMFVGCGMSRADNNQPIFWRTPGYPAYLLPFYSWYNPKYGLFNANTAAQKNALWVQVFLSSFVPILLFFLTLLLVSSLGISWLVAFIFAIHPGFVLASGFMLTEALSVLFFFLFLIFLYRGYRMWGEGNDHHSYTDIVLAACALGIYTWMRPMGQFVGIIALLILALSSCKVPKKLMQCGLFALVFFGSLAPWAIRNYNHTGHLFFWPGSGTYLACFNVPKLKRHLTGRPLKECWQNTMRQVTAELIKEKKRLALEEPSHFASQELVAGKLMWPWMYKYPWWALQDWIQEVCKTTLDLYSYQLVSFAAGTFKADPLEEFLTEKTAACLYAQPLPWFMRFICWVEFFFSILVWFGLWMGLFRFVVQSAGLKLQVPEYQKRMFFLWIKTGLLIGAVLGMTGGFGYARLRMPVEPLMIILSLSWWYYVFYVRKKK